MDIQYGSFKLFILIPYIYSSTCEIPADELSLRVKRAILAGNVPDLLATSKPEKAFIARLAWEGKLVDVLQENVWGKALNRVLVDEIPTEQAADEAILRITEIFATWN